MGHITERKSLLMLFITENACPALTSPNSVQSSF